MAEIISLERVLTTLVKRGSGEGWMLYGRPPMVRVGGELRALGIPPLGNEELRTIIQAAAPDAARASLKERGMCEFAYTSPAEGVFCMTVFEVYKNGPFVVLLRQMPPEQPSTS